jgi:hypothetical protein
MKQRTSVLLEPDLLDRLRARSRRRGTSLTAEIEAAVTEYLKDDDPNAGLRALIGLAERREPWPAVDSDEAQAEYARDIERDTLNREPGA